MPPEVITPRFVPTPSTNVLPATYQGGASKIVTIGATKANDGKGTVPGEEPYVRNDLPGPQRLFLRDSEAKFFERIRHERKKTGQGPAIFPPEPIISKEPFKPRAFARITPLVEPCYVYHQRLYFEQPNFERVGYDFGVLQPAICLGVFYYDMALLPYHMWSHPTELGETNIGKCLPGDAAPFRIPCERFSVSGLLGQSATVIGLGYLIP